MSINSQVLTFSQFLTESHGDLGAAKTIIKTLRTNGFQGYLVGGCVRDMLLGREPKDYDVATDAHPEQVLKLFPHADKVGAHFGVVIEQGIEIATFRSDGAYGDGRRPDSVHYEKSPQADAGRRDFTVNAMYMDPFTGHVLDFYGGQEDIKRKVLRCVGDPHKRFGEDHIRMLRAVRFAAKLGFTIDPPTMEAMQGHAPNIQNMAQERITGEITGALNFPQGPLKTFNYLKATGMLAHIIPELNAIGHTELAVLQNVLQQIGHESHQFGLAAMFFVLDHGTVAKIMKRLKTNNEEQKYVSGVLALQDRIKEGGAHQSLADQKKLMRDKYFTDALKLYGMRMHAGDRHAPHVGTNPHDFFSRTHAGMSAHDLHPKPFINGDDLIAMGMRPGKAIADILKKVEEGQLNGHITSREQALQMIHHHQL